MERELANYRKDLNRTVQKLNESYDKLIITLASGSLVLSLAFLKDVIKQDQIVCPMLLMGAWLLFILSLTSVLLAVLFGIKANEKAVKQIDKGTIYDEKPGGHFSFLTTWSHYMGTIFLLMGFILLTTFVYCNMEGKNAEKTTTTKTDTAIKTNTTEIPTSRANSKQTG